MNLEKKIQILFRFLLFVSSYIPLFIILFVKNINSLKLASIFATISIVPLFVLKLYIGIPLKGEPNKEIKITDVTHKGSEVLNYIVCYIIPFISFNSDVITIEGISIPDLIASLILFLVICNLYMSSNLYYVNPILNLFYDIHSVETDIEKNIIVIAKKNIDIPLNKIILLRRVSPKVFLYTDEQKNKITMKIIMIMIIVFILSLSLWNSEVRNELIKKINEIENLLKECLRMLNG